MTAGPATGASWPELRGRGRILQTILVAQTILIGELILIAGARQIARAGTFTRALGLFLLRIAFPGALVLFTITVLLQRLVGASLLVAHLLPGCGAAAHLVSGTTLPLASTAATATLACQQRAAECQCHYNCHTVKHILVDSCIPLVGFRYLQAGSMQGRQTLLFLPDRQGDAAVAFETDADFHVAIEHGKSGDAVCADVVSLFQVDGSQPSLTLAILWSSHFAGISAR